MADPNRTGPEGGEQTFQVRDRRQFTSEGERREPVAGAIEERREPPPVARPAQSEPAQPPPAPASGRAAPVTDDQPRKRSLRERILGRKGREDEPGPEAFPGAEPPDASAEEINFPNSSCR